MYEPELAATRGIELRAAATTIHHRMKWAELRTIERLEKELRLARGRSGTAVPPLLRAG